MIFILQSVCSENIERSLVRDVHVSIESIIKIADPSYLSRLNRGTLIAPGGETHTILERYMPNSGLERIREAVKRGTNYWGICAGGNMGAMQYIYNSEKSNLRIDETKTYLRTNEIRHELPYHTLNLLPAFAEGPNFAIAEKTFTGRAITVQKGADSPFYVYWNKGSHFVRENALVEAKALYEDKKIAVLRGYQGLGVVLLVGCHPEMSYLDIQSTFPDEWNESKLDFQCLKADDAKRVAWINELGASVGIVPKNG